MPELWGLWAVVRRRPTTRDGEFGAFPANSARVTFRPFP